MKFRLHCFVLVLLLILCSIGEAEKKHTEIQVRSDDDLDRNDHATEFMLRFKGKCHQDPETKKFTCNAKANSQSITTIIHQHKGLYMTVKEMVGSFARLNFDNIEFIDLDKWTTTGNITFGIHLHKPHSLQISMVGFGRALKIRSGERNLLASYAITNGTGEFEKAQGSITVNALCDSRFHLTLLVTGMLWKNNEKFNSFTRLKQLEAKQKWKATEKLLQSQYQHKESHQPQGAVQNEQHQPQGATQNEQRQQEPFQYEQYHHEEPQLHQNEQYQFQQPKSHEPFFQIPEGHISNLNTDPVTLNKINYKIEKEKEELKEKQLKEQKEKQHRNEFKYPIDLSHTIRPYRPYGDVLPIINLHHYQPKDNEQKEKSYH